MTSIVTYDMEEPIYLGTRVVALSKHHTDDHGHGSKVRRGARIVGDYELPSAATSTRLKKRAEFVKLANEIRRGGFDPETLGHVTRLDLRHLDSFQTLTEAEVRT